MTDMVSTSSTSSTSEETAVRYERDRDGIVTLTLDDPTASANTMNELYRDSMAAAVRRLYDEVDDVTGVIVASAKKTFFAGGNLNLMMQAKPADDAGAVFADIEAIKADLRRLEKLPTPGRRRDQRRRPRRRLRDRAGLPPPHRGRRLHCARRACPRRPSVCCPAAAA